ncbi:regulatory protein GntR, HTH [Arcticibacter svalbardensis MN12-7]|uniref:Regulatory protein GntR, HTH n=1 Tax=Arcticibacter svalbardensis MN12-7 TaxID=1150600 RepID=R9GX86_9SPHI|nr:regulatory protein GntR, HTH [Arcticibacter svalbardensis]EOR93574.1 regulatory protein GntR, HTH [Arcticibacter svalbardensis MN12-7]
MHKLLIAPNDKLPKVKQIVYEALLSAEKSLQTYKSITNVFLELNNHPTETLEGIKQFCKDYKKKFAIVPDVDQIQLKKGQVFLTLTESALADLIKMVRSKGLKLGIDIGIISFNETVLKELLDLTVITTNFEEMSNTAANLILDKEFKQVRNSCKLIERSSL